MKLQNYLITVIKKRKRKSIELMESIKVKEWEKNQVFNEISSFEWVELKR